MKRMLPAGISKFIFILIAMLVITTVGIKFYSMRTHDPDNPRSLPNGYLMSHSVTVNKTPEQVFDFITYHMAEHNLSLAKAHDKFEIIQGDGLTEGAVFVAEEYQGDEGVKNRYVVKKVIPNQLIYFSSTPSLIYEKKNGEWVQTGSCNTYVYFDVKGTSGQTQLTQTVVIEMHNFFTKFLIDMIIAGKEGNEWMDHLVEELETLKTAIEQKS